MKSPLSGHGGLALLLATGFPPGATGITKSRLGLKFEGGSKTPLRKTNRGTPPSLGHPLFKGKSGATSNTLRVPAPPNSYFLPCQALSKKQVV